MFDDLDAGEDTLTIFGELPNKCPPPKCGFTGRYDEIVRDYIDVGVGLPCDIEYLCPKCGQSVAYWAYGYFDPSW
jgi:hypothetical protein